jgi:hypothetical protein
MTDEMPYGEQTRRQQQRMHRGVEEIDAVGGSPLGIQNLNWLRGWI